MQLKSARRSEDAWIEAVRFAASPILLAGLLLTVARWLPAIFAGLRHLSMSSASTLIVTTFLVLTTMVNKHINNLFDQEGKRKHIF
ncbi:hypothetical protein [Flavisolibacter nicotianae]|uniref:hypothetical protein n=1 Tax=Flavisolibacter nicotianae TaxID=2364882 RepID=UPI0013C4DB9F|nr:hypothetical protein [Flavisolibacter nicotianae]